MPYKLCYVYVSVCDLAAQRMCASACTVQPLPGDHGKELQIQGTFDTQVRVSPQSRTAFLFI